MTEKKSRILDTALEMFAAQGYHATSTGKLAKAAGVSEGLIFRHFESKEGLLRAILERGREKAGALYSSILEESDPEVAIQRTLTLPLNIPEDEYPYWRLVHALRWSQGLPDPGYMDPLLDKVQNSFTSLGKDAPKAETEFLRMYFDGIVTSMLLTGNKPGAQLQALMDKHFAS